MVKKFGKIVIEDMTMRGLPLILNPLPDTTFVKPHSQKAPVMCLPLILNPLPDTTFVKPHSQKAPVM